MLAMTPEPPALTPRIWQVGALCRAVADALDARFNPVTVRGELTGFSRAASGHCYFSIKDEAGQLRCAMFRRAAGGLDFSPRDGDLVEVQGRLSVYEARGDLQLIVESLQRAGQGALFEQFLRVKARLEVQGLFDAARKRALPLMPRGIGLVTSRGAAALHDVVIALQRRVPHIPVLLAPAAVQGAGAPAELVQALRSLYARTAPGNGEGAPSTPVVDVILMVRGGGSIDDLWAFNDEELARTVIESPVPVIVGVGHETDFTIADFVADLRAPTPTAAAELVAQPRSVWLATLQMLSDRLGDACNRQLDLRSQRLDLAASRLSRPSDLMARQRMRLALQAQRLRHALGLRLERQARAHQALAAQWPPLMYRSVERQRQRLDQLAARLQAVDPRGVLRRGFAWLSDEKGRAITSVARIRPGQAVQATLVDGTVDLTAAQRPER